MAQQNLVLGTPGDNNTGEFVYESLAKIEANFSDLYTNYLPKTGGTISGTLNFTGAGISHVELIRFWDNQSMNNELYIDHTADDQFRLDPIGGTSLRYVYSTGKWEINNSEIVTVATGDADNIAFDTYSTITSPDVQAAIEELKDELDAAVLAAGSGDMLKSTYDIGNSGVVDNSEALEGNNSAYHLSRTNHTGTQTASTISDFDTAVSANSDVTANTAKVTNATHTGDVTGDSTLTIDPTAITGKATVTPVSGDFLLISDTSDSGNLKKVDASTFIASGSLDTTLQNGSTNAVQNNAIYDAVVDINSWVAVNNIEANKIIDGSGSGLDADTLDTFEATQFLRSDTTDTKTSGNLLFNDNVYVGLGTGFDSGIRFDGTNSKWDLSAGNLEVTDNTSAFATFNRSTRSVTIDGRSEAKSLVASEGYTSAKRVSGSGDTHLAGFGNSGTAGEFVFGGSTTGSEVVLDRYIRVGTDVLQYYNGTTSTTIWHAGNDGSGSGLDADTLDGAHYQTASFTATLTGASSGSYTVGTQSSSYTKIGKLVFFVIYMDNITGTTPTGNLLVSGLPFTCATACTAPVLMTGAASGTGSNFYSIVAQIQTTNILFYVQTALDGNNSTVMSNIDFSPGSIRISGCYMTA